jgi:hypothetical protein
MIICYHGTNARAAKAIVEHGFAAGTYFARHLEDAIGFGGDHVFEVVFLDISLTDDRWQFTSLAPVPKSRIVSYRVYSRRSVIENEALRKRVSRSND